MAKELWESGKPLEAGRIIVELLPTSAATVAWAGHILAECCQSVDVVPSEVQAVLTLTKDESMWRRGHAVFDLLRSLTLRVEHGEERVPATTQGLLYVAENTAKVAYNASSPADPFDADSASWIVANVYWIAQRHTDPDFRQRIWRAVLPTESG